MHIGSFYLLQHNVTPNLKFTTKNENQSELYLHMVIVSKTPTDRQKYNVKINKREVDYASNLLKLSTHLRYTPT